MTSYLFQMLQERKQLPHEIPYWVKDGSEYFITICTKPKEMNQLCSRDVSNVIFNAFQFYQDRGDVWVHLLVLMPDHLHAVMSFDRNKGMKKCIAELKKYIAKNTSIVWQRDFFDHRLRATESYIEKAQYIRMNPVQAGLCDDPEVWPYVWENRPYL